MYDLLSQAGYLAPPFTDSPAEKEYLHRVDITPYEKDEFKLLVRAKLVKHGSDFEVHTTLSIPYQELNRVDGHPTYFVRSVLADYINTQFPLHIENVLKDS